MKRILVFLMMLATFASAQQADSTDILIYIGKKDTTQTGRWHPGMGGNSVALKVDIESNSNAMFAGARRNVTLARN